MLAPIGRNVFHCCSFFGLQGFDLYCISNKHAWDVAIQSLSPVLYKLNIIIELLRVKFNYSSTIYVFAQPRRSLFYVVLFVHALVFRRLC